MIDLLILLLLIAIFAGGFWCGKKYQTLNAMLEELFSFIKKA